MGKRGEKGDRLKTKMDGLLGESHCSEKHSDLLFHYTKAETALAYILRSKRLKFGSLGDTNDPLENRPLTHLGTRNVPADKSGIPLAIEFKLPELRQERQKAKLACFCVTPNSNVPWKIRCYYDWGCYRSRMWSQYADNHKGVCLVFSKNELLLAVREWGHGRMIEPFEDKIEYDNKLKALADAINVSQAENPSDRIKARQKGYYFCKRKDYEDESEYRMVVYHEAFETEGSVLIPYKNSLKGILLGTNLPREQNDLFIEEALGSDLALAQLEWDSNPHFVEVESCWLPHC